MNHIGSARRPGALRLWAIAIGLALLGGLCWLRQPRVTYAGGVFEDAAYYHEMALQSAEGERLETQKPFVYRVASPWLIGQLNPASDEEVVSAFATFNLLFGVLTLGILVALAMQWFRSPWIAGALGLLFLISLNGPFRMGAFYPVMTDHPLLFWSALILWLGRRRPTWGAVLAISAAAFAGTLFREATLLAPAAVALGWALRCFRDRRMQATEQEPVCRSLAKWCLPVLAGLFAFLLTRTLVDPIGEYTFQRQMARVVSARLQDPSVLLLAVPVSFGPVLLLVLFAPIRSTWDALKRHPEQAFFGVGVAIAASAGGYQATRIAFWAWPFVFLLVGTALQHLVLVKPCGWRLVLAAVALLQVIAMNPFGSVPDITGVAASASPSALWLFPYGADAHCFHILPHQAAPDLRADLLLQYGVLIAIALIVRALLASRRVALTMREACR